MGGQGLNQKKKKSDFLLRLMNSFKACSGFINGLSLTGRPGESQDTMHAMMTGNAPSLYRVLTDLVCRGFQFRVNDSFMAFVFVHVCICPQ